MSVLRPAATVEGDRADGAKATAGNECADSTGSTMRRQPTSPVPPTLFESSDAAALVFSLAAAALLQARQSPLLAVWALAEGVFYLWQLYR